ncbi:cation:proton antiporter [Archangium violaceum]|uniref:cation:proton antiporter n=1 Tax=Archangium violaceum TaxID=83451 RepID=UPI0019513C39|nr:cation:proton antiporter [Archangium violaceum]QRN94633.1 cation:proton antiporter [Archangium violaceum]
MSKPESLVLFLFVLLLLAHLLGALCVRLRQPRVVGEILAGVLAGPALLGRLEFFPRPGTHHQPALDFLYAFGLLMLMFLSGAGIHSLFHPDDRRKIAWLTSLGTVLPFLMATALGMSLPLDSLMGPAGHPVALLLIIGISVSITSIPVISRIFQDLQVLHTRFARLVLGVAVVEDIALWGGLAGALSLARASALPWSDIARHISVTVLYMVLGLFLVPQVLQWLNAARWKPFARMSPVTNVVLLLLAYAAVADFLDINQVFAGFLAGLAASRSSSFTQETLDSIAGLSNALFIPLYFALVGYKLALINALSPGMLFAFLVVACVIKLASVGLGARLAGFPPSDAINLAVATNARGGPGIAVASVAFDAGIISPAFYTTLVAVAVLTSQAAGAWLSSVLRRGQPLLSDMPESESAAASSPSATRTNVPHERTTARVAGANRDLVATNLLHGDNEGRQR